MDQANWSKVDLCHRGETGHPLARMDPTGTTLLQGHCNPTQNWFLVWLLSLIGKKHFGLIQTVLQFAGLHPAHYGLQTIIRNFHWRTLFSGKWAADLNVSVHILLNNLSQTFYKSGKQNIGTQKNLVEPCSTNTMGEKSSPPQHHIFQNQPAIGSYHSPNYSSPQAKHPCKIPYSGCIWF